VPIIADIDAGFGNEEATYLLAKKMIEAGACAIQIENQVSDEKQCGHQDGKVTVPARGFPRQDPRRALRLPRARRRGRHHRGAHRFPGRGPDQADRRHPREIDDLGDSTTTSSTAIESADDIANGDVVVKSEGKLLKRPALEPGQFCFKEGTGEDRVVLDCITSLQNGADLLWIETEKPHVGQIAAMVNRIREVVPSAKLVYNNSPSFNWTLNFRQQVFDAWSEEGRDVSAYDRSQLMSAEYDDSELAAEADARIRTFQADASREAGIFHHLITLPTYHTAALSTDNLAREYFGDAGMLGYVKNVQRQEIRQGIACVKHQNMAGSDMGDDHKEYFAGDAALKAGGADNTMNQFG
jgi:isocitrate lyase